MTETDALTAIIVRCPDLLRQATAALKAWRVHAPIREQRLADTITAALRRYGADFTGDERAALLALLPPDTEQRPSREFNLNVRVTAGEKFRVQSLADEADQTMSDYIRARIGLAEAPDQ